MNIFVTSPDPVACAYFLDDKRVIKMVLETAQLLSTVLHQKGYSHPSLYKPTHVHHPCTIWAAEDICHISWLFEHFTALCGEYTARYGKIHKSEALKPVFESYIAQHWSSDALATPKTWPNCARNKSLGIDYTQEDTVFTAYNSYLQERWKRDKRPPTWYQQPSKEVL